MDPEHPIPLSTETILMTALSTLSPPQLSDLIHSLSTLFHLQRRRLSALLFSPTLFSITLHHLHSLSLRHKSLLIARHLLSTLTLLTPFLHPTTATAALPPPPPASKLRDLDAVLLLLLLCEFRQHEQQALQTSPSNWRVLASKYVSDYTLTMSSVVSSTSNSAVLIQFVELVTKCRRFVDAIMVGREVAASVAAVVALPSLEVSVAERECVICKEEMRKGRDVCELPCDHVFHWMCILPWLQKRNTCPCCRYRLPTDDVIGEIDRLWKVVVKAAAGGGNSCGECIR